ncbi:glycine cleavage system protein GcvH [Novosphingobium rosa]|uniref:glycine cleavage system protein GcvH n=1 Tax=Novosphingobium rosa TaxID=76978 RepID=UPI00082B4CB7|nr:glycine cleavage system protein GcvH [Novosphingobium rosa]
MTRYFTKEHEWIQVDGDTATVGITDFAQESLGDITFVELPDAGRAVTAGEAVAVVESVKAASDVYAPVAGTIVEGNAALDAEPELVNTAAETDGWLFKLTLTDAAALGTLLDEAAYKAYIAEL